MKRLMENQLTRWLQKPRKKPLVIRGARQVGKSTLVQNFTRSQGLKLAEINLEKHANLNSIFGTNDLDIIIPELELLARTSLRQENTLLFLDEIQSTPYAIAALRYFREEMPQLPVVAIPIYRRHARKHPRFLRKQQFVKHPRRSSLHYSNLSGRFRKIQP